MAHNAFNTLKTFQPAAGKSGQYYSLPALAGTFPNVKRLPVSIRIVLESVLRNVDGKKLKEIVVEYPIGHKRRRKEGMPVLVEKFKTNLARQFAEKQRAAILELCLDQKRLEAMPVHEFVDLMTKP